MEARWVLVVDPSLNHELLERGAYFIHSMWYSVVISMLSDELTLYIFFNFKE